MSVGAVPAASHQGISHLVETLRRQGFALGTSEAIDATRLLLVLAERDPALGDPARIRARIRPALCKSREEQERFDAIFDDWWKARGHRFPPPPGPATDPPIPSPAATTGSPDSRAGRWLAIVSLLLIALAVAYLVRPDPTVTTRPEEGPGTAGVQRKVETRPTPIVPRPDTGEIIDRYVPAVRYNFEVQAVWLWLLAALPLVAFLGVSLPALVLIHTRLRHRSDSMFLDPSPLAREARRLVPRMPSDVADRLARHVRSRGPDIERIARRPVLDVRGTLEATIRNYGIPTLRFSHSRIHPSYLLLIDVANERDPRGRLFYQWAQRLQQQKLEVEILLLRVTAAATAAPVSVVVCPPGPPSKDARNWKPLANLRSPAFGERLLVISDGDPLVDAGGAWRPAAAQARFHRWHDRALFTPIEPRDWGDREWAIERSERNADPGFIVLPLEESALGAWADLVVTGQLSRVVLSEPQRFPALLRHGQFNAFSSEVPPDGVTLEKLMAQLLVYLGDQGFYWLAACAVPPFVRWELTLLLGQAVLRNMPRIVDETARDEALARNYKRLVRLPWMQQEAFPTWLRWRLLAELSRARQAELRAMVDHLLGRLSPRPTDDGIELNFERPPGGGRSAQARSGGEGKPGTQSDALYLGYMSGLTPEQLVLRVPRSWATWARHLPLRRESGWRSWFSAVRDVSRARWARLAWIRGLPHLGFNRASLALAALLTLPLVSLLVVIEARPSARLLALAQDYLYIERTKVLAWDTDAVVRSVAFSPDGTRLVSGSGDGMLRLWDVKTGQPLGFLLAGHTGVVLSFAFSPDGTRLVSGSTDGTLRLWDARMGQPLGPPLTGHTGSVGSVAFSPDGTRLVSGGADKTLRLWDARTGQPLGPPLTEHTGVVESVAFSPDGTRFVSGSGDETLRLWDARMGQPLGPPLTGHTGSVGSVAFSPDGTRLVSGSGDGTLRLWDAKTGQPQGPPLTEHTRAVRSVAFSPDGTRLASGSDDETLRLWDARAGQPIGPPLAGHTGSVRSVAFSPDGTRLASGSDDETLRLWDARAGQPIGPPLTGHTGRAGNVAFSPDGTRLVSGSGDGTLRLWDAKTGQPLASPLAGNTGSVGSVAFSPDGTRLVSGSTDGTLRLWDARTGQPLWSLAGRTGSVGSVAFSPDGTRLVSGSTDGTLRLWDARTGRLLWSLEGPTGRVGSVAFSPDGTRLVSGSVDGTLRLWDAKTGQPVGPPLAGHTGVVRSVAFSPDGTRLVSGSVDGTLRLWDARTGQPVGPPLAGHTGSVGNVAFSPDGTRLVSGSDDKTLRLWDARTGQPIGSPLALQGAEFTGEVVFSPDGRRLAAGMLLDARGAVQAPRGTPSEQVVQKRNAPSGSDEPRNPVIQLWRIDPYPAPDLENDIARFVKKISVLGMPLGAALIVVVLVLRKVRSQRRISQLVNRASESA